MSLTSQFSTRTKEVVDQDNGGRLEKEGLYLAEVIGGYDGAIVYPQDIENGKSRHIGVRIRVEAPVKGENEDEEVFADRQDQVGCVSTGRVYLSENTIDTAIGLFMGISGEFDLDEEFDKKVQKKDSDGNVKRNSQGQPEYDYDYLAKNLPVDISALVGRKFVAAFELNERSGYVQLNQFASYALTEGEQEASSANFANDVEGEEGSYSMQHKERVEKRSKGSGGARASELDTSLLEDDSAGDGEAVGTEVDDDFPY